MSELDPESARLESDSRRSENWKRWGPYLAERQWGTVREDYSADGDAWGYFPHDHARSRVYRWGEDGLLGLCDRQCRLCFSVALWNGRDPILKERLFGLTNPQGNHGEDVKEQYFYVDATPTASYLKGLYKYPQRAFPYQALLEGNARRGRTERELELADTGAFDDGYFDVAVEYAKASAEDILIRISLTNRGSRRAHLTVLPTLWFRNTWAWGRTGEGYWPKPSLRLEDGAIVARHSSLGEYLFKVQGAKPADWLFTENETNAARVFGAPNPGPYVKDAFHRFVIDGETNAVNPERAGTKCAARFSLELDAGETRTVLCRLTVRAEATGEGFGPPFDRTFVDRLSEADAFYRGRISPAATEDERRVARGAYAGLVWSKQYFHYSVKDWLDGDPGQPAPPASRWRGRNRDWQHLYNRDVLSVPDKWEYPWYAAWDLAFHMLPFSKIDPAFAKQQLILFLREWYMHPNGQLPAYEFQLSDVNPPVHAWACYRVYKMSAPRGKRDRLFLERVFQKLLINFTWWVNRKDLEGKHLFSGGFLGLDNIGVFDRSKPLPTGGYLDQADGTAWMAFFCATMLAIALELSREDPAYEDIASKFFEHFIAISDACNRLGGSGLWDEEDGFYYDQLRLGGTSLPLRVRSMVGLVPLLAAEVLEDEVIDALPGFKARMNWFLENRSDLASHISYLCVPEHKGHCGRLLAIPSEDRLRSVLRYMLDEREFLSPFGIRSLSYRHKDEPFVLEAGGEQYRVQYVPGESDSGMFGGNSNWRGPIWMPLNYLLVEALERYHYFYGSTLQVECPTGSGRMMTLDQVARELSRRLSSLFLKGKDGDRPLHGCDDRFARQPDWRDLVLYYEYFDPETGRGIGASHQTGWTALVAQCIENVARGRDP